MAAEQDVDDVIIEDESDDETPRPVKGRKGTFALTLRLCTDRMKI